MNEKISFSTTAAACLVRWTLRIRQPIFIPWLILLILDEASLYQISQTLLTKKLVRDELSSIGLGIGSVFIDFWDEGYFSILLFWFYNNFRLTDIFGVAKFQIYYHGKGIWNIGGRGFW